MLGACGRHARPRGGARAPPGGGREDGVRVRVRVQGRGRAEVRATLWKKSLGLGLRVRVRVKGWVRVKG